MSRVLTREEELAIWLEKKKQRKQAEKEQKSFENSRRSHTSKNVNSLDKSLSKSRTSSLPPLSTRENQSGVTASTAKVMDRVVAGNDRRFSSTPSRKTSISTRTPSSSRKTSIASATQSSAERLQRARNVLKERNYNRKNNLTGPRKRSLSERSPTVTKDPSKPIFTTKRNTSSVKHQNHIGISITVSATRPSLSPISMATLSTPTSKETTALESIATKDSFSPPAEKQQHNNDSHKDRHDDSISKKPTFSFEEDEEIPPAKFHEERRRRTDSGFLFLPTPPSPYICKSETSQRSNSNISNESNKANLSTSSQNKHKKETQTTQMSSPSNESHSINVGGDAEMTESTHSDCTKKVTFLDFEEDTHNSGLNSLPNDGKNVTETSTTAKSDVESTTRHQKTFDFSDFDRQLADLCLKDRIKVKDRTVLESVLEQPNVSESNNQIQMLQQKLKSAMEEKQILIERLSNIRKAYEQRVTPFRDVFDEVSKNISYFLSFQNIL